ncbi:MAG: copper resistance protein CopC, partial [Anaerolineae bacterium]|nr:copper resistance protein CopC [Anaerolineae bacterium]
MPKIRVGLFFVCLLLIIAAVGVVSAHANLQRAEPGPNAVLQISPPEIRLWFTEPLEPQFSRIILRDSDGNVLNTPASFVDPVDAFQMALQPGELPDGLYTVAWRALSAADGHPSMGSYPFVIGDASLLTGAAATGDDTIPVDGTAVRWLNLLSMAFGVGSLGFLLFVWSPAAPQGNLTIENTIRQLLWLGWLLIGLSGALMLLLQYSLATGNPLLTGINGDSLNALVAESRFGHLWLTRMAMWVGLGGAL